ncbi:hypothetical protein PQ478_08985 [Alkalihalophilus pseudofirmus]|uniref:hypothetical protein n=1 Tax=Alkalihalophilus pseudofirmus TaxID=79885 RepID=UPI00259B5211|nr:hypothetical protein [Alkalihalophilus pseudofirmus]WEG18605.1 hypothetical protein PQ478_08985 [Alkalihalophilus pseudofirmus]
MSVYHALQTLREKKKFLENQLTKIKEGEFDDQDIQKVSVYKYKTTQWLSETEEGIEVLEGYEGINVK